MGISCISTDCKIFPGFRFGVGGAGRRYLLRIQGSGEMRAGEELGLRLRTGSIMKACLKIKEELPKLKLRRKMTPQQGEGETLSHDCSPGT